MKANAEPLQRLRQMPRTLATITCLFTLLGFLIVVLAVSPFADWNSKGSPITYAELWQSGGGFALIATGVALIVFARGFYRAQRWVRFAVPFGFIVLTIYFTLRPNPSVPYEWVGTLFWAFLAYWYFNRRRKVVEYFSGTQVLK